MTPNLLIAVFLLASPRVAQVRAPEIAEATSEPLRPGGPATVLFNQKISLLEGGFGGELFFGDLFGCAVAGLGDLDEDGIDDIAVGAQFNDSGGPQRGAVWVLFLHPDGTVRRHQEISSVEGGFAGPLNDSDLFGYSVAGLGDLDGDGVEDMAVGSVLDRDGGDEVQGAVWILFLNPDGTVKASQKISATQGGFAGPLETDVEFGSSLACLGDLDGDGIQDLAVGSQTDSDGVAGAGSVWILFLDTDGTVRRHQKISRTQGDFTGFIPSSSTFGRSTAALGDLDRDGLPDLAVAGHLVWVLFLRSDGRVKSHLRIGDEIGGFSGDILPGDDFGDDIAALGDIDADGVMDLAVAAPGDDDGTPNSGAVWILFLR